MRTKVREEYLAVSAIKRRGWNQAMIDQFLGEPDDVRVNFWYRSGPPMQRYKKQRVEQAEQLPEFCRLQEARKNRREAAQKGVATKRRRLEEQVEAIEIIVPLLDKDELIRQACAVYNYTSRNDMYARPDSDPEFLERICVNYLRHDMTDYEAQLCATVGQVGARDAYLAIKTKVLDAIARQYDWLELECIRQEAQMYEQEMWRR